MLNQEVSSAVEALLEMGVLEEEGLLRLGRLFEGIRAFTDTVGCSKATWPWKVKGRKATRGLLKAPEPAGGPLGATEAVGRPTETVGRPREAKEGDIEVGHMLLETWKEGDPFLPESIPEPPRHGETEKNHGVTLKREGRKRNERWTVTKSELSKLREFHSVEQIADLYGVSRATVGNRLREFGLTGLNSPFVPKKSLKRN